MFSALHIVRKLRPKPAVACAAAAHTLLGLAAFVLLSPQVSADNTPSHPAVDRSGQLRVAEGMTLHLNADLGNIRFRPFRRALQQSCFTQFMSKQTPPAPTRRNY